MMKKFIALLICFIVAFTVGCSYNTTNNADDKKHEVEVVEGKNIVLDSATDYSIVLPQQSTPLERYATTEFTYFFEEATGISLSIKNETNETTSGNYFFFGKTNVAKEELKSQLSTYSNNQKFAIKTVDNSIICCGVNDYGTLWSIYELLNCLLNYEFYAEDTYSLKKNVSNLSLLDISIEDEPDFEYRVASDAQSYDDTTVARRFRYMNYKKEILMNAGNYCHNSFYYFGGKMHDSSNIEDRFLADNGLQLCYTAHGNPQDYQDMLNVAFEYLVDVVNANPTLNDVMFGIEDDKGWCSCSGCSDSKATYGTNSASVIIFCNNLHRMLKSYLAENNIDREVNLIFFAYYDVTEAPAVQKSDGKYAPASSEVKADSGVYVMYAPIAANYHYSFYDDKNINYKKDIEKWSSICDKVYVWVYHCYYPNYFIPYNSFDSTQETYQLLKEYNALYLFDQGMHNAGRGSAFTSLKEYLNSKLAWDVNVDLNELIKKFFVNYFDVASEPMMEYFTLLRTYLVNEQNEGMSGGLYTNSSDTRYWKAAALKQWQSLIEKAYSKIEIYKTTNLDLYTKLYNHIALEEISIRYLDILVSELKEDDSDYAKRLKDEFIADASQLGILYWRENSSIFDVFK